MSVAWPRPRLLVSACLEFEPCRYNGQIIRARFLRPLSEFVDLVPVCPEVEIGLGTPRPPVRLVQGRGETRLFQPSTQRDVTEDMKAFAARLLDGLGEVDGFLLKSRSPSCGPKDVKVYGNAGAPTGERQAGVFAEAVGRAFPALPLEDEGRLTSYHLRHHFLTRVFQGARLRALPCSLAALVRFHAQSKLLLLAHSESGMRELGRLLANQERLPAAEVLARYRQRFARALGEPPQQGPLVNTLLHAFGHLSRGLRTEEKELFLEVVRSFTTGRASLEAPLALLRGWNARFDLDWLSGQSLFEPYPLGLHTLSDSADRSKIARAAGVP